MVDEIRTGQVDNTRLQEIVEQFNELMGGITPFKLAVLPPEEILPAAKNAHFMPQRVFTQLVENIKEDKNLSSLPFCWRKPDGRFVSLSGNHRVSAATEAGVPLILILYTDRGLSRSEQVGIQLSHNSLVGQDDPVILRDLYTEIKDLHLRIYSGLDEASLKTMEKVKIIKVGEAQLRFEELRLLFLPAEIDRIEQTLERIGQASRRRFAGRVEDFERFFDALLDFKQAKGIVNTATGFMALIEIAEDWLRENAERFDEDPDPA